MASLGTNGSHPQNAERDFQRRIRSVVDIPIEPYSVDVPIYNKRISKVRIVTAHVALPHLLWAALRNTSPAYFHALLGQRSMWELFWKCHKEEPWYKDHPHKDILDGSPSLCCPFLIFGDDAQTSKRVGRTVRLLEWYSPVAEIRSHLSQFPLLMVDNDQPSAPSIIHAIEEACVWSFNRAGRNIHPTLTEKRAALTPHLAESAGKPIMDDPPMFLVPLGAGLRRIS